MVFSAAICCLLLLLLLGWPRTHAPCNLAARRRTLHAAAVFINRGSVLLLCCYAARIGFGGMIRPTACMTGSTYDTRQRERASMKETLFKADSNLASTAPCGVAIVRWWFRFVVRAASQRASARLSSGLSALLRAYSSGGARRHAGGQKYQNSSD